MTLRSIAIFTCVIAAAFVACGDEDTTSTAPGTGTQDTGTQTDTGTAADVGTGTDTAVAADVATGTDTSTEPDAAVVALSDLISALTQPCYDVCLLGAGCGEPDFSDLGECEEECDSDAGFILGNAADEDATRACLAAVLTTSECIVALDCSDFATWYATFDGTYPCSAEETAEEAACAGIAWYEDF